MDITCPWYKLLYSNIFYPIVTAPLTSLNICAIFQPISTSDSNHCLMCPTGQFLRGRTGVKFHWQRGSIHVLSASRHTEQHGIQPHRGLSRPPHGWTEMSDHPIPSNSTKQPHWLCFDTVKTIMGFTTATYSKVNPDRRTCHIEWCIPFARLVIVAKKRGHELA